MAPARRRTVRAAKGARPSAPWRWVLLLMVVGIAVLAARTVRLPRFDQAQAAEPTLTVVARAATAAPVPTPVPAAKPATPQPVAAPTAARSRATVPPVQTRGPGGVAAAAARSPTPAGAAGAAQAGSNPTPSGAVGATQAGSNPTPSGALTAVAGRSAPTLESTRTAAVGPAGAVALTFDAGADRGYAEDILDLLQQERIPASFGITGQWAKANPDLVRRMAADGHLVINHTLDHRSFTGVSDQLGGLSAARRRAELDDADAIIAPLIGHSTKPFYRLPYGDDDARVAADVLPDGYSNKVGWTVDSLGWKGAQVADIVARCLRMASPGGILIFHVGRASQDAIALPQVIHGLRDRGFSFRRVDA